MAPATSGARPSAPTSFVSRSGWRCVGPRVPWRTADVLQKLLVSTQESVPQRPDEVLLVGGRSFMRMRMSSICWSKLAIVSLCVRFRVLRIIL